MITVCKIMNSSLDAVVNAAILYTKFFQKISLKAVNYGLVVFVSDFIHDVFFGSFWAFIFKYKYVKKMLLFMIIFNHNSNVFLK